MTWRSQLRGDSVDWLLDSDEPGVRYLALRDLLDALPDDPDLLAAQAEAHARGPIAAILDAMQPDGFWAEPGPGYLPKYRSTVWALITLAQLGATIDMDARLRKACAYLLDHALTSDGQFSGNGAPGGTVDCLQGNLLAALLDLGYADPALDAAFDWMARTTTGDGIAPMTDKKAPLRYYAGKIGPDFACGANNKLACAWGAVKVMLAFGKLPVERRTPRIEAAIERGVAFLLGVDPASAAYPTGYAAKPSGNWWKFGFPVFYITDLLQNVEALVTLGYGGDPRLENALAFIRAQQDSQGRYSLDYDFTGKMWVDFGAKKQPNPWVTLRALRVLKAAG